MRHGQMLIATLQPKASSGTFRRGHARVVTSSGVREGDEDQGLQQRGSAGTSEGQPPGASKDRDARQHQQAS